MQCFSSPSLSSQIRNVCEWAGGQRLDSKALLVCWFRWDQVYLMGVSYWWVDVDGIGIKRWYYIDMPKLWRSERFVVGSYLALGRQVNPGRPTLLHHTRDSHPFFLQTLLGVGIAWSVWTNIFLLLTLLLRERSYRASLSTDATSCVGYTSSRQWSVFFLSYLI